MAAVGLLGIAITDQEFNTAACDAKEIKIHTEAKKAELDGQKFAFHIGQVKKELTGYGGFRPAFQKDPGVPQGQQYEDDGVQRENWRAPFAAPDQGVTHQLCAWVEGLTLDQIPEDVQTRAKNLILDGLGCVIVGAHLSWTENATNTVLTMESPGNFGPLPAALLNSTQIQSFELDDWHFLAPLHSNSIVLPALLAAASQAKAGGKATSGASVLFSTIVRYETGPRVGLSLYGSDMLSRGWHSGVVFGHAAAATSVAKLLDLRASSIEDAVGIACTQACGLMSAQFSSDAKRMQHGFASRNGLFGALMAAGGYSGIKRVFEEPYGGFLTMFSQGSKRVPPYLEEELVKGLGEIWQLESIRVKPYASMAGTHCTIATVAALQTEYPDKLRDRRAITRIIYEMSEAAYKHGGWKPERPLTAIGAQMSCAYVAAVQMVDGQVLPQQFRADQLDREVIWELVEKTECVQNNEFKEIFSQRASIHFSDGSKISKTLQAPKGVDPPLSNQEIVDKYRALTKGLITDERQKAIEDAVLRLERLDDISQLEALLVDLTLSPFR
ncbi:hypothetical protein BJX64DRAFT_291796 [Aspergillus heterothallicus]